MSEGNQQRKNSTNKDNPANNPTGSSSPRIEYPNETAAPQPTGFSSPMVYPETSPMREPFSSVSDRPRRVVNTPPPTDSMNSGNIMSNDMPSNSQIPASTLDTARVASERLDLGFSQRAAIETTMDDANPEGTRVIWGTDIVIKEAEGRQYFIPIIQASFRQFIAEFRLTIGEAYYVGLLRQIHETEVYHLSLDANHLKSFPGTKNLYEQMIAFPQEVISIMDGMVNDVFRTLHPGSTMDMIQVRPFNIEKTVNMRELDPNDIDKLVAIKGLVIRTSSIIPDMRAGFFKCVFCGNTETIDNVKGRIEEPSRCANETCRKPQSMQLIHNLCIFSDKQIIRLQETPDSIPDGQTPHTVSLVVYDSLVDVVRPGDRVQVTGIFRSAPVRVSHFQRTMKSVFRTYIDVVHVQRRLDNRMRLDDEEGTEPMELMEENVKKVVQQCGNSLYSILADSVAPSIFGHEDTKKGLLLQLFGGNSKTFERGGSSRFRGDIHVLLAGDPGVSKSQMLQYVHKLAPRGLYTSGKGSSAVGLTAYITRDPETRQVVLESGALVLSDGGICCIDEFDKMSDSTRAILHEAMEQQTVSIAKRGIIATLNSRTSVLAAANPVDSKYNPNKSIVENLNLPPTLLSRFDLIYVLLDKVNKSEDRRLAQHLIRIHILEDPTVVSVLDNQLLTNYIAYGRRFIKPILTESAGAKIVEGYLAMRRVNGGKTVSATTRQLESLIRLAEAHAKMRLSETVEPEDAEEALRLIKEALLNYALDPTTGRIDMDLINTGKSSASRDLLDRLKKELTNLLSSKPGNVRFTALAQEMQAQSSIPIAEGLLFDALRELDRDGTLSLQGSVRKGTATVQYLAQ